MFDEIIEPAPAIPNGPQVSSLSLRLAESACSGKLMSFFFFVAADIFGSHESCVGVLHKTSLPFRR
jgi:hypothetical protein